MSKIVLVCLKNRDDNSVSRDDFNLLSEHIMPDNITAASPLVNQREGVFLGVINPNPALFIKDTSICAGHMLEHSVDWWHPLSPLPDGAYAMFRSDDKTVELATDILASRTIWYLQTETMFIASTSQRPIIFFMQSFELNETALVWMLSSGSLGLGNSWDRRIKCLLPDSRLRLDRDSWEITVEQKEICFTSTDQPEQHYKARLKEALEYSFSNLSLDYSRWALSLSGGYDSREILLKLKDKRDLNCFTWGGSTSLEDKDSDAIIGKKLAEYFDFSHIYFNLEQNTEPIEKVFRRFIYASEGRTSDVSKCNGLEMHKSLYKSGIIGIIRGDEAFGWPPILPNARYRQSVGCTLLQDFSIQNITRELIEKQFGKQVLPSQLGRKKEETPIMWGDRLYQQFRVSVHIGAWNEPSLCYFEVIQPFLSRKIIETMRAFPDYLRLRKALFRKIVNNESPKIPYGKRGLESTPFVDFLRKSEVIMLFSDTLDSTYYRGLYSSTLIDHIIERYLMETQKFTTKIGLTREALKRYLPNNIKDLLRRNTNIKLQLNFSDLAFRAYIGGKTLEMFSKDAKLL